MSSSSTMASQIKLLNPPTLIENQGYQFLIFDAPSNQTLPLYIHEFKKHNVTDIVRVCEPTYLTEPLESIGIKVHRKLYLILSCIQFLQELAFSDGKAPPKHIVIEWLEIIQKAFHSGEDTETKNTIGIHCVAGLGRAPVLVAIALIEQGMSSLDSVQFIRERRRGAINNKQIEYIEAYRRQARGKCTIS
ncbi:hypothetical protein DSO57_1024677 [Entomophthora muscae]|uniref:Uncharacterized protein n=1 Tax=Entomophthora muscae TaxID=34485 RepID=A0ACC2RTM9_9FUNG|nr:hypothetical protein DSO57_1024677 [Entomophthora muscae]